MKLQLENNREKSTKSKPTYSKTNKQTNGKINKPLARPKKIK